MALTVCVLEQLAMEPALLAKIFHDANERHANHAHLSSGMQFGFFLHIIRGQFQTAAVFRLCSEGRYQNCYQDATI